MAYSLYITPLCYSHTPFIYKLYHAKIYFMIEPWCVESQDVCKGTYLLVQKCSQIPSSWN